MKTTLNPELFVDSSFKVAGLTKQLGSGRVFSQTTRPVLPDVKDEAILSESERVVYEGLTRDGGFDALTTKMFMLRLTRPDVRNSFMTMLELTPSKLS